MSADGRLERWWEEYLRDRSSAEAVGGSRVGRARFRQRIRQGREWATREPPPGQSGTWLWECGCVGSVRCSQDEPVRPAASGKPGWTGRKEIRALIAQGQINYKYRFISLSSTGFCFHQLYFVIAWNWLGGPGKPSGKLEPPHYRGSSFCR